LFGFWAIIESSYTPGKLSWWSTLGALFILSLGIGLVIGLLYLVSRDSIKAGICASILMAPLLDLQAMVLTTGMVVPELGRYRYAVPLIIAVVSIAIVYVIKSRRTFRTANQALNILFGLLVVLSASFLIAKPLPRHVSTVPNITFTQETKSSSDSAHYPDIYYFILDSYTSSPSLKEHWGFDNNEFLSQLRRRGFYVAERSESPYTTTVRSVATSLNMDTAAASNDSWAAIRTNIVVKYLRTRNFTICNYSLFDIDQYPKFYSYWNPEEGSDSDIRSLFRATGIVYLIGALQSLDMPRQTLRILAQIVSSCKESKMSPKFVYAHLMTPHFPYRFDEGGKIIPWLQQKGATDKSGYLEQLIGTNALILAVIDSVLELSKDDPIIIVQGDHGSRLFSGEEGFLESHTILNAYHLPKGGNDLLYPTISPVNSFRLIFDRYFGQKLPLVKDFGK
jgi:hypothetical protein